MLTRSHARSLHSRLLLVIMPPLLLLAAIMTVWRYDQARTATEQIYDNALLSIGHVITRDVVLNQGDLLVERLLDTLRETSGDQVFYYIIGEPTPTMLSGYTPPPKLPPSLLEEPQQNNGPVFFDSQFRGQDVRVVYFREHFNASAFQGWVRVTVWQHIEQRQRRSLSLAGNALAMLSVLLLATAAIVWFGISYGLKPLADLQHAIEQRSPDDLSPIKRTVPREVASLVSATNHLFGQVRDSIAEKDTFIANAAHQIRNPIAGLLSQAEAAERTDDNDTLRQRVANVAKAARHTARLTQQMLSIERIQQTNTPFTTFDLGELLRSRLAGIAHRALQQNVELSLSGADTAIWMHGDPLMMGEVLDNILDNALRYGCPNGGQVDVSILLSSHHTRVSIRDSGLGISAELLPHLFERFTRGKEDNSGGAGLGLAICQSIVQRHGGSIVITLNDADANMGCECVLQFPNALDIK